MAHAVLATAILFAVAACGKGAEQSPAGPLSVEAPPSIGAAPKLDLLDGKVFPVDAYRLTPEKLRQLNNAQTRLVNKCLAKFGFPPSQRSMDQADTTATPLSRRYGVTDPADAAQYGYRPPADGDRASRPPEQPASPELNLVLYGQTDLTDPGQAERPSGRSHNGVEVPTGGCLGESKRALHADAYEQADPGGLAGDIELAAGRQADADDRVKAKIGEWSACMKAKGYDYTGPFDPVEAAQGGTVTQTEIQTATADVECKRQVNLIGVWFTVEVAYQEALIDKNRERLDAIRTKIDAMLKAAAEVPA